MSMDLNSLCQLAIKAARSAGHEILAVYRSVDVGVEYKEDQSPLTRADKVAHQTILQFLRETDYPVLSEEGSTMEYTQRKSWNVFWLVDPLDGTKEFIRRNGEFTVNIALIEKGKPVLGVVYVPVTNTMYYAFAGNGSWVEDEAGLRKLPTRKPIDLKDPGLRVVASRSHLNPETASFIEGLVNPSLLSAGSSLKFMLVASGAADVYPRLAPTMEWDTAAAHCIVTESGLNVWRYDDRSELRYNKESLTNPGFIVC